MNKFLSFLYNQGLIIGGALTLIISIVILINGLKEKQITQENNRVKVKIVDCYKTGNNHYFLKFEFNKKTFIKRTKAYYCNRISNNEEVTMLTNKQLSSFIFLDEFEKDNNFTSGIILSILAVIIIFKGFKQKKDK